jgi:uncharacterized protein GlcG (DUF336 family)
MRVGIRSLALALLCASSAGTVAAEEEPATVELRVLSPRVAHSIVLAAVQDCSKRGYKVSASVVDRNGNLSAFLRDPLSGPHTVKVSQRKAFTAATSQMSTAQLSSRQDLNFAPDMLLIVGGVPISFNGHFYGGVAVAGAPPETDEKCAQAGIEAVSDIMDFVE